MSRNPWRGRESDAIVSLTAHHPLLLLQPHPARTAMPSSYHCCSYMPSYNPTLLIYAAAPGEEVDCHPHFHIFSGFPHWDIFCCGRHCHLIWLWIMDVLCLWVVLECIPPKSSLSRSHQLALPPSFNSAAFQQYISYNALAQPQFHQQFGLVGWIIWRCEWVCW